jgi:hypothetical protein
MSYLTEEIRLAIRAFVPRALELEEATSNLIGLLDRQYRQIAVFDSDKEAIIETIYSGKQLIDLQFEINNLFIPCILFNFELGLPENMKALLEFANSRSVRSCTGELKERVSKAKKEAKKIDARVSKLFETLDRGGKTYVRGDQAYVVICEGSM